MPNHLCIPFKKTYSCSIPTAARDYIRNYTEDHPDAYIRDINQWKSLREIGTGGVLHADRIKPSLQWVRHVLIPTSNLTRSSYHAQLVFILAKLPSDVSCQFMLLFTQC